MRNIIQIDSVSKRFRRNIALDNLSLDVPKGVVFALLGENGAGKTTLIEILLGLMRPNRGSVDVLGIDPLKHGVKLRSQIGYVSDSPALYDWMTVKQIGWFASGFYRPSFYTEYEKLVSTFQLDSKQRVKYLSKGGRAKVALALAMAHQPELLILDEPTSGLDAVVRRHFLESMIDVAASGKTVFISSHQIAEVERVADHVAIINQGKIVACDTLENLKANFERWVVTLESADTKLLINGATVVEHDGKGQRRQQLVVRDCQPDTLWQIRDQPGVIDLEVHPPTLEEVFVALMRSTDSVPKVSRPDLPPSDATDSILQANSQREASHE